MNLKTEAAALTKLLAGKVVRQVRRHRAAEVLIEFADGTRLFVDAQSNRVECSVTGGNSN